MATKAKAMKDDGVKIELKGKPFVVKFDLNALCELQDKFGDITKAFEGVDATNFKKVRSLLHIGLANGENEDISEKEVGTLIDLKNMDVVTGALSEALYSSMPESSDDEGK